MVAVLVVLGSQRIVSSGGVFLRAVVAVDEGADALVVVVGGVDVPAEGRRGGLVSEESLDDVDRDAVGDEPGGVGVPEVVVAQPLAQAGAVEDVPVEADRFAPAQLGAAGAADQGPLLVGYGGQQVGVEVVAGDGPHHGRVGAYAGQADAVAGVDR